MNVLPVALLGYLLLGLELGLRPHIGLGPPDAKHIAPSLVLPLVLYVAMFAPANAALWLGLATGLVVDLTAPPALKGEPSLLWVVGPNALGYLAAAYFVVTIRGFMIKRNPLTLMFLSICGALLAGLVAVAILTVRHQFHGDMIRTPGQELGVRFWSAIYTGVVALGLSVLFSVLSGVLGIQEQTHRRYGR